MTNIIVNKDEIERLKQTYSSTGESDWDELKNYLTINESGKVVEETQEGYSFPADYSFETVNVYVNKVGRQYEELASLCLGMATHIDKQEAKIAELEKDAEIFQFFLDTADANFAYDWTWNECASSEEIKEAMRIALEKSLIR